MKIDWYTPGPVIALSLAALVLAVAFWYPLFLYVIRFWWPASG